MLTCAQCNNDFKTAPGLASHTQWKHPTDPVPTGSPTHPDEESVEQIPVSSPEDFDKAQVRVGDLDEAIDGLQGDLTQEIANETRHILEHLNEVFLNHGQQLDQHLGRISKSVSRLSQRVEDVCHGLIGLSEQLRQLQQPEPAPRPENEHSDEQIVVIR